MYIHTVYNGEKWTKKLCFPSILSSTMNLDVDLRMEWSKIIYIQKKKSLFNRIVVIHI